MKITVVTVSYNNAKTIADTILSVKNQSHSNIEHIIIDGGSNDGTQEIAYKYGGTKIISESDNGIYDAMNKGIKIATGDAIGFLNADDVYYSSTILEKYVTIFSSMNVDAIYSDLVYMDKDLEKIIRYWKSCPFKKGLYKNGWMPAHPTFYVKREVYERLGGYNTSYKLASDFELTLRFLEIAGIQSYYLPEIAVKMRMGGVTNKNFKNIVRGNIESYQSCRNNGLNPGLFFIIRKIASRLPQFVK